MTAVADCFNSSLNNYLRIPLGLFTLKVPKESAGEHFEGLQMLTSLLAPKGSRSARPLVEDISAGEDRNKPRPPCPSVCETLLFNQPPELPQWSSVIPNPLGISEAGGAAAEGPGDDEGEDEEEYDWQVEQEVYTESSEAELAELQKYGFGNQRAGVFARLQVSARPGGAGGAGCSAKRSPRVTALH